VAVASLGIFLSSLVGDAQASVPLRPGDLDTTVGADGSGQATFNFGDNWDAGTRIMVQPDGKYIVAGHGVGYVLVLGRDNFSVEMQGIGFLARYLPDGSPDTSFNRTGRRVFGHIIVGGDDVHDEPAMYLNDVLIQPDGKIVAVGGGRVTRLNADGSTDVSFANGGDLIMHASTVGFGLSLGAIGRLSDGRLLIAGSEGPDDGWGGRQYSRPFTLRLLDNGQPDASYGPGGRVSHGSVAEDLVPRRIALQASGKATVIGGDDYSLGLAIAIRLNGDGTTDTSFANAGKYVATVDDSPRSELEDLLLAADGSLVMVGQSSRWNALENTVTTATFAIRLTPSGQPDTTFGKAGVAILSGLTSAHGVTKQPDGKLLISGSRAAAEPNAEALVARLMPTGELDATFGTGGVTTQSLGAEANATAIDVDGRIVLVGAVWRATGDPLQPGDLDFALTRFVGVEAAAPPGTALVEAVEYYHQQFEHYFVTADPVEIGALDSGVFAGWWRTGQRYRAYADAGPDRAPVCRFYTDAFAGKGSHFYTASTTECEYVKGLPEWTFEGNGFYAQLPGASGQCAAGTAAIHRLYNDGRGGAPNHAYTPDAGRRDRLIAAGWVAEGTAWCAPLASEDPAAQTMLLAQSTWELPSGSEIYDGGQVRTTFAAQLSPPAARHYAYAQFDVAEPPATIYHQVNGAWGGAASFEPLTGRFLVVGRSGFEGSPYVGDAWELETGAGPISAGCVFDVKQNVDARYPTGLHPFQPVLWSGCTRVVAKKL
jgi:uncharacterized delta-60 repeat protein